MRRIKDREARRQKRIAAKRLRKQSALEAIGARKPESRVIELVTMGCHNCGYTMMYPEGTPCKCIKLDPWLIQRREYTRCD